nr:hypothetical protein [Desulfobulbaceae bacterium]
FSSNETGNVEQFINVSHEKGRSFIVARQGKGLWAFEAQNITNNGAFVKLPPTGPNYWDDISWIGFDSARDKSFFAIKNQELVRIQWGKWNQERVDYPVDLFRQQHNIIAYYPLFPERKDLFVLAQGAIHMQEATSNSGRDIYFSSKTGQVYPGNMIKTVNGGLFFADRERRNLYFSDMCEAQDGFYAEHVFGPTAYPSPSFCVDAKGIVYAAESVSQRLHVVLPDSHWNCISCGKHSAERSQDMRCPFCGAELPEIGEKYRLWFDIDLSGIGTEIGPIHVDADLRLYVVTEGKNLFELPLQKNDFWGTAP